MVADVTIVDDSYHNVMIVENVVVMCSMLAFVVAVVAYAVALDSSCQHSNRVNIDASIRCQFVVMDDFLFRPRSELVLALAVYPMDHADPDGVTEIEIWTGFFNGFRHTNLNLHTCQNSTYTTRSAVAICLGSFIYPLASL